MPKRDPAPPAGDVPKVGPSKDVVRLSEDLERLLREEQRKGKVPAGMDKCPVCGIAVEPTRVAKVRTHDDPLTGARCEGSQRPWSDFPGAKRTAPAGTGARKGKARGPVKPTQQRRLRVRPPPKRA